MAPPMPGYAQRLTESGHRVWINVDTGCMEHPFGPAVVTNDGTRIWMREGVPHRDGGKPAVVRPDGTREFWLYGQRIRSFAGGRPRESRVAETAAR